MPTVFISYSRWNREFAKQLKFDLERAGVSAWLDTSDILAGRAWNDAIRIGIEKQSHFVLLVSPESNHSEFVRMEFEYAKSLGKPLIPLLIGGNPEEFRDGWSNLHMLDFCRQPYGDALPELFRNLSTDWAIPRGYAAFLNRLEGTVADAAKELGGRLLHADGKEFAAIPLGPTAYTTTWLIGPAGASLRLPEEIAGVLHFSGPASRRADREVLEYLTREEHKGTGWMVLVEGPVNLREGKYSLTQPHIWRDGVDAAVRAVEGFLKFRHVRFFLNCPVQMGFAVALRARDFFRTYRLYHHIGGTYQVVIEGTRG